MRKAATLCLFFVTCVALARDGAAQYTQYTPPGSLAVQELPAKERLEKAMEEAKWRLGPLRLAPWVGLNNVSYLKNVFVSETDQRSDYTATAGVGLHGYLRAGGKVTIGLYALPEYVWWRTLENRRVWNGRYGVGVFGYFNRMTLEAGAGTTRDAAYLNSEFEQPVNQRRDRAHAQIEIKLLERFALYASGSGERFRLRGQDFASDVGFQFAQLDRDDKRYGGGLRYYFRPNFKIGLGWERVDVTFVHADRDRSNSGTAPVVEISAQGKRLWFSARAVFPTLKPASGSQFVEYHGSLGTVQATWKTGGALSYSVYGNRNLAYSALATSSYFVDERGGVAVESKLGWRSIGRVFGEAGKDTFAELAGAKGGVDTVRAYGAAFAMALGKRTQVSVQASQERYSSRVALRARDVNRFDVSVRFLDVAAEWW